MLHQGNLGGHHLIVDLISNLPIVDRRESLVHRFVLLSRKRLRRRSKVAVSGRNVSCICCFSVRVNWWLRIGITSLFCFSRRGRLRLRSRLLLLRSSGWVCNRDNYFRPHGLSLQLSFLGFLLYCMCRRPFGASLRHGVPGVKL